MILGCWISVERASYEPLKGPVVATVCGVRVRDGGRVVHCRREMSIGRCLLKPWIVDRHSSCQNNDAIAIGISQNRRTI